MSTLTTHVLDTSRGRPAAGVPVRLDRHDGDWKAIASGVTDPDGRLRDWIAGGTVDVGRYRLTFDTASYFSAHGVRAFYPFVEIVFDVDAPAEHFHVPLLLAPFGYSTYRGS
jgi:5-hydroxyisourate hydrolase